MTIEKRLEEPDRPASWDQDARRAEVLEVLEEAEGLHAIEVEVHERNDCESQVHEMAPVDVLKQERGPRCCRRG